MAGELLRHYAQGSRAASIVDAVQQVLPFNVESCYCVRSGTEARTTIGDDFADIVFHFETDVGMCVGMRIDEFLDESKVRKAVFRQTGKVLDRYGVDRWDMEAQHLYSLALLAYRSPYTGETAPIAAENAAESPQ